jgi:hemolysin activation/secretion protein
MNNLLRDRQLQQLIIYALPLALFSSLSAQAAPAPPDAGQVSRELNKLPAPAIPKAADSLRIDGETASKDVKDGMRILVKAIRVSGNTVFPASQLEALVSSLTDNEHTLAELDAGAARITAYYRKRGYVVARAYLPAQDIKDGVVTIAVLEGQLGQQRVTNQSRLADEKANGYLSRVKSGDVLQSKSIDRVLLLLNDTPGVGSARATLQPGASVGTSDLLIELAPAAPVSGSVELDNYGNRYTGENRLGASLAINSPLKTGDQLTVRALASDQNLTYARIGYAIPLGANGLRAGVAYSDTRYKLGKEFASLQAHGSATSSSIYAMYPFLRSLATNLSATLSWEDKRLNDKTDVPVSNADKQVRLLSLGFAGNHQDALGGGGFTSFELSLAAGNLSMDAGSLPADTGPTSANSNGTFTRLAYSLNRLQYLADANTLSVALSGQQASKNLNSSEKFSLGGAYGVRAYPQGEGSGDEGMLVNLELRRSLKDTLQGVLLYDAGQVKINRNPFAAGANTRTLSGAGFGINATLAGIQLKAYAAWRGAGGAPQSEPATINRSPRVWIQAGKQF